MKISDMVDVFFPADQYEAKVREYARCLAENVERQTRHKVVSSIYDLANKVHNDKE